eukprot:673346-Ditylum_brightwellii.AAC.1
MAGVRGRKEQQRQHRSLMSCECCNWQGNIGWKRDWNSGLAVDILSELSCHSSIADDVEEEWCS